MRILTYKRTHIGDPDQNGRFGIYDCMGRVRSYDFDAVIGIGGIGPEPKSFGIDQRINWVGINANKQQSHGGAVVMVTFEKFLLLEDQGPVLETIAPHLARRMYDQGARILLTGYSSQESAEAEAILHWAARQKTAKRPSKSSSQASRGCRSRCQPATTNGCHR